MTETMNVCRTNGTAARSQTKAAVFRPTAGVFSDDHAVVLTVDLPGAPKEGVSLTFERGVLTVDAPVAPRGPAGRRWLLREYRVGDYRRQFTVGDEVDADRIAAEFRDGVLRVTLPKRHPVARQIAVGSGS